MTSSLLHLYEVIKQFSVSVKVEIELLYLLSNLAEIWHMSQFESTDLAFELKKSDIITT